MPCALPTTVVLRLRNGVTTIMAAPTAELRKSVYATVRLDIKITSASAGLLYLSNQLNNMLHIPHHQLVKNSQNNPFCCVNTTCPSLNQTRS